MLPDLRVTPRLVYGQPGLLVWVGQTLDLVAVFALDAQGRAYSVYLIRNPDQLSYLRRQLHLS